MGIYMKNWNENDYTWSWITAIDEPLTVGEGYIIWSTLGNPTVSYTGGVLNKENVSPAVTATDYDGTPGIDMHVEGWNLIGNPYPSAIDIMASGYTWTNIDNTLYFWDGVQYVVFNRLTGIGNTGVTQYIPSMQSFFVKAHDFNPELMIPNSARVHNGQENYKASGYEKLIRLTVEGNNYSDEIIVMTAPDATSDFDNSFDAYKLFGTETAPQFYSLASGNRLSINTLGDIVDTDIVELGLNVGFETTYTIKLTELDNFSEFPVVLLEDKQCDVWTNLLENPAYTFAASPLDKNERFALHFSNPEDNNTISPDNVSVYAYGNIIYVKMPENTTGLISVYDLMGREVAHLEPVTEGFTKINMDNCTGYYFVKIQTGDQYLTEKLFLK